MGRSTRVRLNRILCRSTSSGRSDGMTHKLQMAPILWGDRHAPPQAIVGQAQALEQSGVADYIVMSDHLVNFVPPQLWTQDNTPLPAVLSDPDSLDDPFVMATYAKAHAPSLNVAVA